MDAVTRLHTMPGPAVIGVLAALALVALAFAVMDRPPAPWVDVARRVVLALLVALAALGLVLALRGASPAEWIHWLYGVAILATLLAPGAARFDAPRAQSAALAAAAFVAALLSWRLWASG